MDSRDDELFQASQGDVPEGAQGSQFSLRARPRTADDKCRNSAAPTPGLFSSLATFGIVRRPLKVPQCSVLATSGMRRKRLCRDAAMLWATGRAENTEDAYRNNEVPCESCEAATDAEPTEPGEQPVSERRPMTPKLRRRQEVVSDYTLPTESWSARTPCEASLENQRQNRRRIVIAERTTPPETIRAAFRGKSLLEERWIGNLDDAECDTELSLPAVLAWFKRTELYKHTLLTDAEVVDYMQQMLSGREVAAIGCVAGRRSKTISAVQFQALVHWIARHKGITFSECIAKLCNHPSQRTRLENYFAQFAHGSSRGFMTVYEFTRFCKTFGLFKVKLGRFVEGDVQFLFAVGGEGKAVDLEGFRRLLSQVANRLDMTTQALMHFLGEKDAERTYTGLDEKPGSGENNVPRRGALIVR